MLGYCSLSPIFALLYHWLQLFGLRGRLIHKHAAASNLPTLQEQPNCISPCSNSRFRLSAKGRELSRVSGWELCPAVAPVPPRWCRFLTTWSAARTVRSQGISDDSNVFMDVRGTVGFIKSGNSLYNVHNSPLGLRHGRSCMKYFVGRLIMCHC